MNNGQPDPLERFTAGIAAKVAADLRGIPLPDMLAQTIARAVAQELMASDGWWKHIIREVVLQVELEHEAIRRGGIGPALLWHLRRCGVHVYQKDGRLFAGPREKVSATLGQLISGFRFELLQELK